MTVRVQPFSQTPLVGVCPASSDPDWHLKVENPNTGHAVGDVNYKRLPLWFSIHKRGPLICNGDSSSLLLLKLPPVTHAVIHVRYDTWSGQERVGQASVLLNNSAVLPGICSIAQCWCGCACAHVCVCLCVVETCNHFFFLSKHLLLSLNAFDDTKADVRRTPCVVFPLQTFLLARDCSNNALWQ